jgi:hypothetical protein
MARPLKVSGFSQGIYEQSATKKETLGKLRFTEDGRAFRYAKNGGVALTMGQALYMAECTANHIKQVNTGYTMALGATSVTLLVGATAVTANMYDDGYLQIYDGAAAAVGQNLLISSHGISAAGSEGVNFVLKEGIIKACIATDTYSLIPNPWNGVLASAALAHGFAGVSIIPVTASYYCWVQTGGLCNVLNQGGTALGTMVNLSATASATLTSVGFTSMLIGECVGYAAITAKYCPIQLRLY